VPKAESVPGGKGGGEFSRLLIEENGKFSPPQEQQYQKRKQAAGRPLFFLKPIRLGDIPEPMPQAAIKILCSF